VFVITENIIKRPVYLSLIVDAVVSRKNAYQHNIYIFLLFVFLALQPIVVVFSEPDSGLYPPRFRGFTITHNDAPQSVGIPWTSDQSVAETST
jgi:hypothetical protein